MFMKSGFGMSRKHKQIDKQVAQIPMVTIQTAWLQTLASQKFFLGTDHCHLYHFTWLLTRRSQHKEM